MLSLAKLYRPIFTLCLLYVSSNSFAACEFDPSPIHRFCEYYAKTQEEAQALCDQKVTELAAEGYDVNHSCFGVRADAGWFTRDIFGNRKYPFQFVRVAYDIQCDGDLDQDSGLCTNLPDKVDGCDENLTDNPCNVATGNKFRSETDFSNNGLSFTRAYNSRVLADAVLGKGWRHNLQKALLVASDSLIVVSSQGRGEPWTKNSNIWVGDADSDVTITESSIGFELTKQNGSSEEYDLFGVIQSETDTNGHQRLYSYDVDGNLSQVTNHYGQSLLLSYSQGYLATVTDPLGAIYKYEYDTNNNLVAVIYPDTTPTDDTDNPRKIYHYENPDYPNHLTGITDENGDRYATFAYDVDGKAILSELGTTSNPVGQEKIELDYQGAN